MENGSNDYIDLIRVAQGAEEPSPQRSRHCRHDFRTLHRQLAAAFAVPKWRLGPH